MSNDLEAATDRVFAAMDDYRTGEAVHATRQVAKALARAALEGVPGNMPAAAASDVGRCELTWGDVYTRCLRRGFDHGAAAFSADQWEKKHKAIEEHSDSAPCLSGEACDLCGARYTLEESDH